MYENRIMIEGGHPLCGEIRVHGAKNAALPILSASLLLPETVLHNCPVLTDVTAACRILKHLGCSVLTEGETLLIETENACCAEIPKKLTGEMRGSVIFLGAMLARFGRASLALPGGCKLGPRPIDIHLNGLRQMGALIEEADDMLFCLVPERLKGADITLRYPSVGATENLLIAAVLAKGETFLRGAAKEPEIDALSEFLVRAGANIRREPDGIRIRGVSKLSKTEYRVIPDRIEAATYLAAAAAAGGEICIRETVPQHLSAVLPILEEMGCAVCSYHREIYLSSPQQLRPIRQLTTGPYPAFPTDALPPIMVPALLARGESDFMDSVFDGRYLHIAQLIKMGAQIRVSDGRAAVFGGARLKGSSLQCTDLRGGAALLVAALSAEGISTLSEMEHLYRGYAELNDYLKNLGCAVREVPEKACGNQAV